MGTVDTFIWIIAAFYLVEAAFFVKPGAWLFSARFGTQLRPASPDARARTGRESGDLALGSLWPAGHTLIADPWPLRLGERELSTLPEHAIPPDPIGRAEPWSLHWSELGNVEVERRLVHFGAGRRLRLCADGAARHFAGLLARVRELDPHARAAAAEAELERSLDDGELTLRWEALLSWRRSLGRACVALAASVLLGIPLAGRISGGVGLWSGLALAVTCLLAVMFLSWRAQGAIANASRGARALDLLQCLVSPAHAMHAYHRLARDAFATWHPLALARVACGPEDFRAFARRVWLAITYPRAGEDASAAARAALARFLDGAGLERDELCAAPSADDPSCRGFCPRCDRQYTHDDGVCQDCGGVALRTLTGQ